MDRWSRLGPYVVVAGCLASASALVLADQSFPAVVIAVLLGCGMAALLYGLLGGVEVAEFNIGPLRVGGSAAVLLGGTWLINGQLVSQQGLRLQEAVAGAEEAAREEVAAAVAFDPEQAVEPRAGWFAVDSQSGEPISVHVTHAAWNDELRQAESIREELAPLPETVPRFRLEDGDDALSWDLVGKRATSGAPVGTVRLEDVMSATRLVPPVDEGSLWDHVDRGRLFLGTDGKPRNPDQPKAWPPEELAPGLCSVAPNDPPVRIEAQQFYDGASVFRVTPCGRSEPSKELSLTQRNGKVVTFDMDGVERDFLIVVTAADHTGEQEPPWSRVAVVELKPAP